MTPDRHAGSLTAPHRLFPIMGISYNYREDVSMFRAAGCETIVVGMPWSMIAPHEQQAQANHSQTLKRLAERGGLDPSEALAVLDNRRWHKMDRAKANAELARRIEAHRAILSANDAGRLDGERDDG